MAETTVLNPTISSNVNHDDINTTTTSNDNGTTSTKEDEAAVLTSTSLPSMSLSSTSTSTTSSITPSASSSSSFTDNSKNNETTISGTRQTDDDKANDDINNEDDGMYCQEIHPTNNTSINSNGNNNGNHDDQAVTNHHHHQSTTTNTTTNTTTRTLSRVEESSSQEELQVGDHVYQWRSWMGIPGVFQHHGIVMDIIHDVVVLDDNTNNDTQDATTPQTKTTTRLVIADFSNVGEYQNPKNKQTTKPFFQAHQTQQPLQPPSTTESSSSSSNNNENNKDPSYTSFPQNKNRRRSSSTLDELLTQEGMLRTYSDDNNASSQSRNEKWYKVEYQAPWWKRSVYRAGTCTAVKSDPVGLVLARVYFILQHPDLLPKYHVIKANCECVAVWCKTGHWCTLQASSILEWTAAGQVKSATTLAATAASTQVSVTAPAAGIWGWLGYTTTTQVSWLSLHPMVLPALAGYAVVSIGTPTMVYMQAKKEWKATTERLLEAFWNHALEHPNVFAECITHWSEKNDNPSLSLSSC